MTSRSRISRFTIVLVVAMLIAILFPAQISSAGTIWHEGPTEFANGIMVNLSIGPGGLSLSALNESMSNGWKNMTPTAAPPPRLGHAMVYDSSHDKMVLFGGENTDGSTYFNDTWTYDLSTNNWTNMSPPIAPSARVAPALAYDSAHEMVVLFGGDATENDDWLGDTWTYNLNTNRWTNMNPSIAPSARAGTMVYDNAYAELILFGGQHNDSFLCDTWAYNLSTNNWRDMNSPTSPPSRAGHAMAYDCLHDEVVLFGGHKSNYLCFNDTWTYNLSTNNWTWKNPKVAPPPRECHAMVYDNAHEEIFLFGGLAKRNPPYIVYSLNDTWTYNVTTNNWTNYNPLITPIARGYYAMVYDTSHNNVVLFGGVVWKPGGSKGSLDLSDTWIFNTMIFRLAGNYMCSPYDTGGIAYFGTISWDADVPPNGTLYFKFRSADTRENLTKQDFIGPDGTINSVYNENGVRINSINNGSRWFQYQAYLSTNDILSSPILRSFTINYNLLQSVKLISPGGGEDWTGFQNITWTAIDKDNDSLSFYIVLENTSASIPLSLGLPDRSISFLWNASLVPNGTYHIRMVVKDNNLSIPLTVFILSNNFTVYHLLPQQPPNHPPRNQIITIEQFPWLILLLALIVIGIMSWFNFRNRRGKK
jgi:N-acetylneuraminic acid mutarotase